MSFGLQWPWALLLLTLLAPLVALYALGERRRRHAAAAFGNPALLPGLVEAAAGRRRHVPAALVLLATALLLVGLTRPRAAFSIATEQATVLLAIDVSGSMRATDVKPSRLAAARAAANAFIEELPSRYRVGIVSFSDSANAVLGPTTSREAAHAVLANLRADGGTAIGAAILRSVASARPNAKQGAAPTPADGPPTTILLLSDGAQTAGPAAVDAAATALAAGITVSTVTLGTAATTVDVPVPNGPAERVEVKPDPATLQKIAETGHGTFQAAPDATTLRRVYSTLGSQLAHHDEPREITAIFAGAGAFLLLAAIGLSTRWYRRAL